MGNRKVTEVYVCIYVPEFPTQALVRLRPELTRLPVVVLEGDPPLEQVCSANRPAIRLGVRHGMTRTELDSFVGLHILKRSTAEERSARAALLSVASAFTPRMEIQPSIGSAWTLVLDMAGSTSMFGPIERSTQSIKHAIKTLRFSVHIASSGNLYASVCLAPFAIGTPLVVQQGAEARQLAPLPLAALNLSPQQTEAFELWGLHTIAELAAIPETDLIVRLGQEGKRLRLLACGEHPHLMVPEEPVFVLEEFLELDTLVELLDSLLFILSPMIGQLIARAQNHALALASLTVKLGLDGGGEHQRTLKPALPLADRELLLKLLHLDLQAHPPSAGIVSILVSAEPGDRSKVQLGLFSPQLPEPTRLDITLARIAALVGKDRVGRAKLLDRHQPESFRMERFLVPATSSKSATPVESTVALRRCRPPVPIYMRKDGTRLTSFHLRGMLYIVEQAYGPWRKSGDWWSPQVWSLEEWDVQAKSNDNVLLCVLSHNLLHQQWHLEALYD